MIKFAILSLVLSSLIPCLASDELGEKKRSSLNLAAKHLQLAEDIERIVKTNTIDQIKEVGRAIEALAGMIVTRENQRNLFRTKTFELYVAFLNKLDELCDRSFDPRDRPQINVAPPGNLNSGVSPDEIKDSALRQKYLEAIQENSAKAQRYRFQRKLLDTKIEWLERILNYVQKVYAATAQDTKEVNRILEEITVESTRRRLYEELESRNLIAVNGQKKGSVQ